MSESFRHREVWRNRLLILPSVLLLTAFVIYPAFVAIQTSLTNAALTGPAAMSPRFIGLANYSRLLSDGNFWRSLAITSGSYCSQP